jgi:histone H3/H4
MLVVKSQIKEAVKESGFTLDVSSDLADKLHQKLMDIIKDACERAKNNGRKTVMGKDV